MAKKQEFGVSDGIRTRDLQGHNLVRYPLRYAHHKISRPRGIEPLTTGLEIRCSIRLSYGRSALIILKIKHFSKVGFFLPLAKIRILAKSLPFFSIK